MRPWLAAAGLFAAATLSTIAAKADILTVGRTTFDFDAPAAPLTVQELRFFQAYKDAVNRHDEAGIHGAAGRLHEQLYDCRPEADLAKFG